MFYGTVPWEGIMVHCSSQSAAHREDGKISGALENAVVAS
tara:strand:- start:215 stop:334 length:120 start_codon:yes stop_codon:yes gene_type:complete